MPEAKATISPEAEAWWVSHTLRDTKDMLPVLIYYTNWRGESDHRVILPLPGHPEGFWYGTTEWHPEPQYFLKAWDLQKNALRDFACEDIKSWMPSFV